VVAGRRDSIPGHHTDRYSNRYRHTDSDCHHYCNPCRDSASNRDTCCHGYPDRHSHTRSDRDGNISTGRHSEPDTRGYAKRYADSNRSARPRPQYFYAATCRNGRQRDDRWIHHHRYDS
jgi:hypothetical protein